MILIVGAVIPQYPHYHNYFILTVMVNIAWLMGAIGWMSAAAAWNPFLPDGPPWVSHAAPRGRARRARLARRPAPPPTTTPTASIAQTPPTTKNPRWRMSPSPWRRRESSHRVDARRVDWPEASARAPRAHRSRRRRRRPRLKTTSAASR